MRIYVCALLICSSMIIIGSQQANKPKPSKSKRNDCVEPRWSSKAQCKLNQTKGKNFKNLSGPTAYEFKKQHPILRKVGCENTVTL